MKKQYHIESGKDHLQVMQMLEDRLYEHNAEKVNRQDGRLFSRVMLSDNNDIIAGIAGWTWAGICEITQFWVDASVRGNGIGKMLLEAAESEAKNQGCGTILVRSYSFQAPQFYEKQGYQTQNIIEGFPPGHRYHILTKDLTKAPR